LLYNEWAGKRLGERELKLWGSERDIFEGAEKASTKLRRWGFNVVLLNSFAMSDEIMTKYVQVWNHFKPKMVWAYTSSVFEFAEFIRRSGLKIFSPNSIVCTAETLTEQVRTFVQEVFRCPVLNQYGSREVGIVGCECLKREGLHTFHLHNKVEILDDNLQPCKVGQTGNIYVTALHNFSMPLIRYDIGDMAIPAEKQFCSCGRVWPLIQSVTGRTSDHFKTRDGRLIHGEYFTHLFYGKDEIKKFRVIQHDYENVEILVEINEKIKFVLGDSCKISFNEVDEIPGASSGKYRYTISEIR